MLGPESSGTVSSYEAFMSRPEFRSRLLATLGLPAAHLAVFDGNAKWYGDAAVPAR